MKKIFYLLTGMLTILSSCHEDDIHVFDTSPEERVAEAMASLKADLTAPANGWRLLYKPESSSGSFYVLMKFEDDYTVNIKSDLGANNGEFFDQTITYRIDNSLGLELIFESYCFFSYLFELDQASFGAEYEFIYVNKTPDNELVFRSKTDPVDPTILVFREARAEDANLPGPQLGANLEELGNDLQYFTPTYGLIFEDEDLQIGLSMDIRKRTATFSAVSQKSSTANLKPVNFTTGFYIQNDSLVFESPFQTTFLGNTVTINSIRFGALSEKELNVCSTPLPIHSLTGTTSSGKKVVLETSITDMAGGAFAQVSDFYVCPINNIVDNGRFAGADVASDITGALAMQLYYNNQGFYAIGFVMQNASGSISFALREFTPVLNGNNLVFQFDPEISIYGDPNPDANVANVNKYLDALASEDRTYILKYAEGIYEFHNPCTGWSFVFINAND